MAKRRTNGGGATASGRGRNGAETTVGGGNDNSRSSLAVKTNDKGQVFSPIRQKWLVEEPEETCLESYRRFLSEPEAFVLMHGSPTHDRTRAT